MPSLGETIYAIISFPIVFMGTPALAVFITRKLTKDSTPLNFTIKIFRNKKALLFSISVPSVAIFLGTVLFFLIFPEDLDFQGSYISATNDGIRNHCIGNMVILYNIKNKELYVCSNYLWGC